MPATSRLIRTLVAASAAVAALAAPGAAQAAVKPAWCPSFLTSGVAVQFGADEIIPGRPIVNSESYTFKNTNPRPVMIDASWDRSWASTATMTVSIGAEYGLSPLATVRPRSTAASRPASRAPPGSRSPSSSRSASG